MYGTIFRLRVKPGREADVLAMIEEWWCERAPQVAGVRADYLFRPDGASGELVGVALFADRESYRANAEDPDQDRWYRRFRALLEADPQWEDGEVVSSNVASVFTV